MSLRVLCFSARFIGQCLCFTLFTIEFSLIVFSLCELCTDISLLQQSTRFRFSLGSSTFTLLFGFLFRYQFSSLLSGSLFCNSSFGLFQCCGLCQSLLYGCSSGGLLFSLAGSFL